jgi:hypothetical protein
MIDPMLSAVPRNRRRLGGPVVAPPTEASIPTVAPIDPAHASVVASAAAVVEAEEDSPAGLPVSEAQDQTPAKNGSGYGRRVVTGLAVMVVTAGALVIGYFALLGTSSVKGEVKAPTPTPTTTHTTVQKPQTLKANYFSLQYASTYMSQSSQNRDRQALEQFLLTANTFYDKEMAITIRNLPSGNVQDDASFKLRQVHSDEYQDTVVTTAVGPVHVMVKQAGGEQVAFVPKGGVLATIALTTTGPDDNLASEMKALLASFQWSR